MNASDYLLEVVSPTLSEAESEPLSMRRVLVLIAVVDALAARVYQHKLAAGDSIKDSAGKAVRDDSGYREFLSSKDPNFRLLRDLAKAQKHAKLDRGGPLVSSADQTKEVSVGFGQGGYGEGPYGGGPQIIVEANDKKMRNIISLCRSGIELLKSEF